MKSKKPQLNNAQLFLAFMLIALVMGIIDATGILRKKVVVLADVPSEIVTPIIIKEVSPIATVELLSNGTEVINTKTKYFENEVQVWLASDEACKSVGLGDNCRNDLMAMAYTESRSFNYKAMGDGDKSYGAWQIHLGYHPEVTIAQATDPYWAARWTINRMIKLGYKTDRAYAIRSHNGNPKEPQTLPYLQSVNKYLAM